MGTSQSSKGPKNGNALVPPWADQAQNGENKNLSGFRTLFGRFARSRDNASLKGALGRYSRQVTGGGGSANARLSNIVNAGGGLFELLNDGIANDLNSNPLIDLNGLSGLSCEEAISRISQALSEGNEDADKIQTAMNDALVEALDGKTTFDPKDITDDILIETMIYYLTDSIFIQVTMDAGKAWNNAQSAKELQDAENDLYEYISAIVDNYMAPKVSKNIRSFSKLDVIEIQKNVITEVWDEWKGYSE
ncbi:hypothetical protein ACUBYX_000671 [Providencia rettgeri]|uniref:hypothetical protein n=1 Tax=Providencia rettgeri TaxID=587 RepID=UPI0018C5621A|nr:hypothetical protein [Providencia rettgeri]MBG5921941.1 hypothetical protein [Providencia rettgeri]HEM8210634.1 hypothetical protein [Providencia rettgeri]